MEITPKANLMKISDILFAARAESPRFRDALAFVCKWEATLDKDGSIVAENDHDGEGITFCGLTQKSDALPVDANGTVTASPGWIVTRYLTGYWNLVLASTLPFPVGECAFNFGVNCGNGEAAILLQKTLNALGLGPLAVDGGLGPQTLDAVWKADANQLARALCAQAVTHYHGIVAANPERDGDLNGWIHRTDDLLETFCTSAAATAAASPSVHPSTIDPSPSTQPSSLTITPNVGETIVVDDQAVS